MRDRGVQSSPRAPSSIVLISCRPVVDLRQVAFANNLMQLALRLSSHFVTPFGEGDGRDRPVEFPSPWQ
jgi:hypothetical protein